MNKEEEIRESLEFCEEIYTYYEKRDGGENFYSKYKKDKTFSVEKRPDSALLAVTQMHEEDAKEEKPEEKESFGSLLKSSVLPIVICVLISFVTAKLLTIYVVQITVVHGESMEKAVSDGDKLIVGKLSYLKKEPERFDMIVFAKEDKVHLIKRIIGLPGELVEIKEGIIYIDGKRLSEDYGLDPINPDADPVEMKLQKDEYFVLGDNRKVSLDSRYETVGAVKKSELIGKALVRIYPLRKMGAIRP